MAVFSPHKSIQPGGPLSANPEKTLDPYVLHYKGFMRSGWDIHRFSMHVAHVCMIAPFESRSLTMAAAERRPCPDREERH